MRRSASAPVRILLALVTLVLASACATTGSPDPGPPGDDVVVTAAGPVRGSVVGELRRFRGIPYAAPPVGELRWRSPQPPAPWTEVRDATALPPSCPQAWERGPDGAPQVNGVEDCLVVIVDAPLGADGPVPVMVFVHGGGLSSGQGAPYDAARVVTQGQVVVVTINYRLGALGFLDHPALDDPAVGNFGLADQQAALRWVRDNIAAFGGDPGNVTLWGESAGAFSTCAQIAAPGARELFHRAVVQSGPCGNAVLTRDVAEQRGVDAAADLGCGDPATAVECLRSLPLERLVTVYPEDVMRIGGAITDLLWYPVAGTPSPVPRRCPTSRSTRSARGRPPTCR